MGGDVEESNATLVLQERSEPGKTLPVDLLRGDIQEALDAAAGEPIELLLDLEARRIEGDSEPIHTTVALSFDTADLERLLNQGDGDHVRLSIDGERLHEAMLAPDVEAHGMREKLVVFATVAVLATGSATVASASPLHSGDLPSGTATAATVRDMPSDTQQATVSGAQARVTARDMPADSQLASMSGAANSVARDMPADSQAATLAAASGSGAVVRDMPADSQFASTAGAAGSSSVARDMPADTQAATTAGAVSSSSVARDMPADTQAATTAAATSASVARDLPADSQAASLAASQTGASGSAESVSLPSPETVLILGGITIALLGAGFAASRARPPRPGIA